MATTTSHNKKSSAVKRILSEARELREPTPEFCAYPLDDNIFEWHFTLRGPRATEFEQGYYHGRILLPVEYPFRPPDVMILTPNGRWELNKKICLTFTGFHEEMWQPAWGIRTALIGVQAFMGARAEAAVGIGSLDYPTSERERLAGLSSEWTCPVCQKTNLETIPASSEPGQERVTEALPDGLTVDTEAEAKKEQAPVMASGSQGAEAAAGTIAAASVPGEGLAEAALQTQPTQLKETSHVLPQITIDGDHGPSDALIEQLVRSRLEASEQIPSISSSQVSTPGPSTPLRRDLGGGSTENLKGKGKEREKEPEDGGNESGERAPSHAAHAPSPASLPRRTSSSSFTAPFARTPSYSAVPSQRHNRRHARHPSSAEASAQRLAALDRAIVTVICLLAALVLRRVLNAWT